MVNSNTRLRRSLGAPPEGTRRLAHSGIKQLVIVVGRSDSEAKVAHSRLRTFFARAWMTSKEECAVYGRARKRLRIERGPQKTLEYLQGRGAS